MNMSEEYIGFYIDASRARGNLNARLREMDKYWEGDVNKPTTENEPGSNVNIVHANIEGQVSQLMEQNISINPIPVTPHDRPFAKSVATMLEFIKEKNRLRRVLDIHERRREKYEIGRASCRERV